MDVNAFMAAETTRIAEQAGVKPSSVVVLYSLEDGDQMAWTVRIAMVDRSRRRPVKVNGMGFGASIRDAASMALEDVHKWEAAGYQKAEPA